MRAVIVVLGVVLGLLCLAPAAARADEDEAEARQLFVRGNRAFDEGRYSDALAAYRASFELVPRASTLFNIGTCRDRLGDEEGAYVDLARFRALAEKKDAPLVARAEARLAQLKRSLLLPVEVVSTPVGAEVRVDGGPAVVARTPATLKLGVGPHTLALAAPRHRNASASVDVVPGKPGRVEATLEALGALAVTSWPADASITLEGHDAQSGRLDADLEPGTYKVTVSLDGYSPQTVEVPVSAGAVATRHVALVSLRGAGVVDRGPPSGGGGPLKVTGLAIGVVGLVALGVGVQQGLAARSSSDDAQDAATQGRFDARAFDDARAAEKRAIVLWVAGGAAVVGGGVLAYLGHRQGQEPRVTVAPTAGGLSAAAAWSF